MKSASLHRLLENTYTAHKKDIYDVAGGHLNHNNLPKLEPIANSASGTRWKTSKPNKHTPENPFESRVVSKKKADDMLAENIGLMKNAMLDFSVGTVGALPQGALRTTNTQKGKRKKKKRSTYSRESRDSFQVLPTKSEIELENLVLSEIEKLRVNYKSNKTKTEDLMEDVDNPTERSTAKFLQTKRVLPYNLTSNVYSEELKLPELMLPTGDENVRLPPSVRNPIQESNETKNKFITTHHAAITKKDQFKKFMNFETNVLHKYETMEQNVRDGHKAVDHLEQKLIRRLLELENNKLSVVNPNFERLQVYSEIWADMCIDSTCLGKVLSAIKNEYDEYLSYLLDDVKKSKHSEILSCIRSLSQSDARESDVEDLLHSVEELEEKVSNVLLQNADLQKKIKIESERIKQEKIQRQLEEEDKRRRMLPVRQPMKRTKKEIGNTVKTKTENLTLEDKLRSLRKELWVNLDELKILQNDLKTCYVPKIIHKNFIHAVKDTELEIQKLLHQKQQIEPQFSRLKDGFNNEVNKIKMDDEEKIKVESYFED